jgi:hypothetical protein
VAGGSITTSVFNSKKQVFTFLASSIIMISFLKSSLILGFLSHFYLQDSFSPETLDLL